MPDKLTRQQIYDRIRATSKDSYILEEMQRLGFWETTEKPSLPELLIKRETELNKELQELLAKDRKFGNPEAMLKEMRLARMKKAKEKREETKLKNEQKRSEKARQWESLQQGQIIYLGADVSKGLNRTKNNTEQLQKYNLPIFSNVVELSQQMNVSLGDLRYLLYNRKVSKITHYHIFEIPKKSGGKRVISAPKKKLKFLQHWVLHSILDCLPMPEQAHGFRKERSIVTNAQPHIGKDIVINVDLKDFFPSIGYKRVKGLFEALGYSEQLAIIFALICTQPDMETVRLDGINYYVQKGERFLPQGSPASPAISNLIVYKMDKRIKGLADKLGFCYTRYADDLTFSCIKSNEKNIRRLLYFLNEIVISEGFALHPDKTHIMRKGNRQKVTGIVVNQKQNVERSQLRKFRALLHNIDTKGWNGQQWGSTDQVIYAIEGYINFVKMVNPEKGMRFTEQLQRITEKHGYPITGQKTEGPVEIPETKKISKETPIIPPENKKTNADNEDWWNILS